MEAVEEAVAMAAESVGTRCREADLRTAGALDRRTSAEARSRKQSATMPLTTRSPRELRFAPPLEPRQIRRIPAIRNTTTTTIGGTIRLNSPIPSVLARLFDLTETKNLL
jgi:hypothetical protein